MSLPKPSMASWASAEACRANASPPLCPISRKVEHATWALSKASFGSSNARCTSARAKAAIASPARFPDLLAASTSSCARSCNSSWDFCCFNCALMMMRKASISFMRSPHSLKSFRASSALASASSGMFSTSSCSASASKALASNLASPLSRESASCCLAFSREAPAVGLAPLLARDGGLTAPPSAGVPFTTGGMSSSLVASSTGLEAGFDFAVLMPGPPVSGGRSSSSSLMSSMVDETEAFGLATAGFAARGPAREGAELLPDAAPVNGGRSSSSSLMSSMELTAAASAGALPTACRAGLAAAGPLGRKTVAFGMTKPMPFAFGGGALPSESGG
mmetsp:Transcript_80831/g.172858  ORF Transcript_80831/g.172858 Transcript_80831/m.172858 type:complete len:335 (-) Transcript_80831:360-1364(-)